MSAKPISQPPMLAIIGPTASGKSALAHAVASRSGAEIISCDSVQVYRGFEIGCAKPSQKERQEVPYHLLDVVDWHQEFDAAKFRQLAQTAIAEIRGRGRIPILCGGTGLFLRVLRFGMANTPPGDEALRKKLRASEEASPGYLLRYLQKVDPESHATIDLQNSRRVERAIEIYSLTGTPASVLRERHGFRQEEVPMRVVGLVRSPQQLATRIDKRAAQMVESGLGDEVKSLIEAGVDTQSAPFTSIGYRQAVEAIASEKSDDSALVQEISAATRKYAKRQRTWFRKERGVEAVAFDNRSLELRDDLVAWLLAQ